MTAITQTVKTNIKNIKPFLPCKSSSHVNNTELTVLLVNMYSTGVPPTVGRRRLLGTQRISFPFNNLRKYSP